MRFLFLTRSKAGELLIDEADQKHLQVLRVKGEVTLPAVLDKELWQVTFSCHGREAIISEATQTGELLPGQSPILLMPLFDEDRMRMAVEKACELGVSKIQLYYSDHCSWPMAKITGMAAKISRWHTVVRQACQQSGNLQLPTLHAPQKLDTLLPSLLRDFPEQKWLVASVHGTETKNMTSDYSVVLVGPEGDFSKRELTMFKELDLAIRRFSNFHILRVETAVISFLAGLSFQQP